MSYLLAANEFSCEPLANLFAMRLTPVFQSILLIFKSLFKRGGWQIESFKEPHLLFRLGGSLFAHFH